MGITIPAKKETMAKKTQTQTMTDAYGDRFSQQDLTTPEELMQPQQLHTPEYEEGDLVWAKEKGLPFGLPQGSRQVPRSTVQKAKGVR